MRNFSPAPDSSDGQTSEIPAEILEEGSWKVLRAIAKGKYDNTPYREDLLRIVLERSYDDPFDHRFLFEYLDLYRDKPYGQELFEKAFAAAKKSRPHLLLQYYGTYSKREDFVDIFADAADQCIRDGYSFAILKNFITIQSILSMSAENLLEQAFSELAKDSMFSIEIFININLLETRPYAKKVLLKIAKFNPEQTIRRQSSWAHLPYADEIRAAVGITTEGIMTEQSAQNKDSTGAPTGYGIPTPPPEIDDDNVLTTMPSTSLKTLVIRNVEATIAKISSAVSNRVHAGINFMAHGIESIRNTTKVAVRRYGLPVALVAATVGGAWLVLEFSQHKTEQPAVTKQEPNTEPPPKAKKLATKPAENRIDTFEEAIRAGVLLTRQQVKEILRETRRISRDDNH